MNQILFLDDQIVTDVSWWSVGKIKNVKKQTKKYLEAEGNDMVFKNTFELFKILSLLT